MNQLKHHRYTHLDNSVCHHCNILPTMGGLKKIYITFKQFLCELLRPFFNVAFFHFISTFCLQPCNIIALFHFVRTVNENSFSKIYYFIYIGLNIGHAIIRFKFDYQEQVNPLGLDCPLYATCVVPGKKNQGEFV